MNWERVESARATARFMLAIPWLAIAFLVLVGVAAPMGATSMFGPTLVLTITGIESSRGATGIPIDKLPLVAGLFGLLIGFAWMWKLYRAPTKYDGAIWRYRDH